MSSDGHVQFDSAASHKRQEEDNESDNDNIFLHDARPLLPKAAFFMGDLRDGLPMVRPYITCSHK